MQRRKRLRWAAAAVVALVAAGCNGDDDAGDSTEPTVESTVPETTESPPSTTAAPSSSSSTTTTTSTTVAPSTTMSEEDLRAEIAADYLRSWELRLALLADPTLEGLDNKLAEIAAPGSDNADMLRALVEELVELEERVVPGTPDEFRVDVERVDVVGQEPGEAVVTTCLVSNTVRLDAAGRVVSDFGIVASRSEDHVVRTSEGWLPDGDLVDSWQGLEVTECPPA